MSEFGPDRSGDRPRVPLFEVKPEKWPEIKQERWNVSQASVLLAMYANGEITQEELTIRLAALENQDQNK